MGLSERDFWRLSPFLFEELLKRKLNARKEADLRAGVLATLIYYSTPKKHKKTVKPETFFPSLKGGGRD